MKRGETILAYYLPENTYVWAALRDIKLFQDWGFDLLKYVKIVTIWLGNVFIVCDRYDNCAGGVGHLEGVDSSDLSSSAI